MNHIWLKAKQNKALICGTLLFATIPLLFAFLWTMKDGETISRVYLPTSYWNDELFYYKQVEAVVKYGMPQGYFGFNESHALKCCFAAWSPIILLPWCVWGFLFGWKLTSPIYANIFYTMLGMGCFYLLVRPTKRQSLGIVLSLAVFTPFTRYMLSGMPESFFLALAMVYTGLCVSYLQKKNTGKLVVLWGIAFFATLSRPYLGVLLLFPALFTVRANKKKGIPLAMGGIFFALICYAAIAHFLCAPYLHPIIDAGWLKTFWEQGILAGIANLFSLLWDKGMELLRVYLKHALKYGLFAGDLYAVTGVIAFLTLCYLLSGLFRKGKKENAYILHLHYMISVAGMLLAIFLLYKMGEGSKHLMFFILWGILLFSVETSKEAWLYRGCILVACFYFFILKAFVAPYDWQVPYDDGMYSMEGAMLKSQTQDSMALNTETKNPDDNTAIWLSYDYVNGESVVSTWGLLYYFPAGMGLNFCTREYVEEHFHELKAQYLVLIPDGDMEKLAIMSGWQKRAGTEKMCVYEKP